MRIWLPKRWSRAKRKRRRAAIHWMREVVSPALKKCLDNVWGDAMDSRPRWADSSWSALTPEEFIDDSEYLSR